MNTEEKSVVEYRAKDGTQIKLSPQIIRKYLVSGRSESGRSELVTDQGIFIYEIIAEPDSFVRKVNGFVKPLSDRLKALEALLKRKLSDHAYQVELQRREIERKQTQARIELQKQVDSEAKAKGV